MKTKLLLLLLSGTAVLAAAPPTEIILPADPKSPIASGVALPAGQAMFWTSGTVPDLVNPQGKTIYERYGDTRAQAVSTLKNIEKVLAGHGLGLKDVVYLRVYLVPDAAKEGKPDFAGWFKAYGEFFNNAKNPTKTARSTMAVSALVSPEWLIEIEAFAAYPVEK